MPLGLIAANGRQLRLGRRLGDEVVQPRLGGDGRTLSGAGFSVVPFTAQTRMSGVDFGGHEIRKGAADAVHAPRP